MQMKKITPVDEIGASAGKNVDYHGVMLRIARANSPEFRRRYAKARSAKMSEGARTRAIAEALAGTVLVGWNAEQVLDSEDNPVEFSHEAAVALLTGDEDLFSFVIDYSTDLSNFLREEQEVRLGN